MPSSGDQWPGEAVLDAVTDAIVALHLRYYHRAPSTAKAEMLDENLLCVTLGGIYTNVEKTLIEVERGDLVSDSRSLFQDTIRNRYIDAVQGITGRTVEAFISKLNVGPDIAVELFVFSV